MNCLIDKAIQKAARKRHKVEVIRRYIRMKYRIQLDTEVLESRLKQNQKLRMA